MKTNANSPGKIAVSFGLAVILALVAIFVEPPSGLSVAGWRAVLVLIIAVVFWVSEVIPNLMASLLLICLIPAMGIMSQNDTFTATGCNGVFFTLAAFCIAACFTDTSIPKLLLRVLIRITKSSRGLIVGITCIGALISMFVANGASTAMTAALATGILSVIGAKPGESRLGRGMMLAAIAGAQCGGVTFPMSNIVNVVAVNLLDTLGYEVPFGQWAAIGIPLAVVSTFGFGFLFALWARPEKLTHEQVALIQAECKNAKITSKEIKLFVIIAAMLYCWIFTDINMALVAVGGAILMLLPGVQITTMDNCRKQILPEAIFLIMAANAVVTAINAQGVGDWICNSVFQNSASWPLIGILAMLSIVTVGIHFIVPAGAAVVGVVMAIVMPLAVNAGFSVAGCVVLIAWLASYMPVMPTDAIFMMTYGSGYWSFKDVMKSGVGPLIFMLVVSGPLVALVCTILGLP
ncbi:MAG: anion permease [Oscillospiraceae bacterium]|nr:anion permease [Oscillospiraceae bacterium]